MKKMMMLFGVILFISTVSGSSVPFSETVSIQSKSDLYALDYIMPVYVNRGSTYEMEDRTVHILIGPQISSSWWDSYLTVQVSISIADSSRTTADFHSYLNCNLENCDVNAMEGNLYWDHAGKKRADLAGELFTEDSPLVISDGYCNVTVLLKNFLTDKYLPGLAFMQGYESDLECPVPLIGLTLEITIDYSEDQAFCVKHFEEASAHYTSADSYFQDGDLDNALSGYEEAKTIYDQLGDMARSDTVQDQIEAVRLLKASEYVARGDQFFAEEEFDNALTEYEKAKEIYDAIGDKEQSSAVQNTIEKCQSYRAATEDLEKGIELFKRAEGAKYKRKMIEGYEEAKSYVEEAKTKFEQVEDSEKATECTTWISKCTAELEKLTGVEEGDQPSGTESLYSLLVFVVVGVGAVIIMVILKYRPTKPEHSVKKEIPTEKKSDELKMLKTRLARGEITTKEFEELKSVLEE